MKIWCRQAKALDNSGQGQQCRPQRAQKAALPLGSEPLNHRPNNMMIQEHPWDIESHLLQPNSSKLVKLLYQLRERIRTACLFLFPESEILYKDSCARIIRTKILERKKMYDQCCWAAMNLKKAAKNRIMRCQCGRLDEIGNAFDAKPPKIGLPC